MASNNSTVPSPAQLPNPFTPMAFLPPDLARQVTVATYVFVGALGVMVWDILDNVRNDYSLLFKHRISLPTVAYIISRLGALGYALSSAIFATAPVGDCARFGDGVAALYPVAVPATALLFFFRVRAVFDQNKFVVAFFAFLWLAVLAGCITVPQGITGSNIGSTEFCLNIALKGYIAVAGILPLIHDTLIFLAISFRLMANTHFEYTLKHGVRTLLFGDYLPSFSKAFLQDGQVYYLAAVTTNVLAVIMFFVPTVPVIYRSMFTVPNVVTANIMACRVFRNTKFGLLKERNISNGIRFESGDEGTAASVIPLSLTGNSRTKTEINSNIDRNIDVIDITKTIEHCADDNKARYSTHIQDAAQKSSCNGDSLGAI